MLSPDRPVDTIIVHCSDSPDDRTTVNAAEIRRWHLERGFKDIGYHFVVDKDGILEPGRHLDVVGAHCEGHNQFSVGICWVGRSDCNLAQWKALILVCNEMLAKYKLPVSAVKGHHDFNPHKTCPNIDVAALRSDIEKYQKGCL